MNQNYDELLNPYNMQGEEREKDEEAALLDKYSESKVNEMLEHKKETFSNGAVCEGDFVDGKFCGKGKYISSSGTVYEGNFIDSKFDGNGKITFVDGTVYDGDFVDGKLSGIRKITFANGIVYEGNFADGKLDSNGK